MRLRSFILLLAIILVAAGCGSSSDDVATSAAESDDSSDVEQADSESASDDSDGDTSSDTNDSESDGINSPIAELFGLPVGDADAFDEQIEEIGRAIERNVATCMLGQGFEYTPVDFSDVNSALADIDFESRAFAEEWGFGIATGLDDLFFAEADSGLDPNIEYTNSLSEGEREAYNAALYGAGFNDEGFTNEFEPEGCLGEAFEQSTELFVLFETFGDELEALEDSIEADPRIVDASNDWSGCMSAAGYGYNTADDAYSDIQRQYDTIVSAAEVPEPDFDEVEVDPETGLPPQDFLFPSFSPETQAEIDGLADVEREVAVSSWECEEPQRELAEQVRIEYEQGFVDEYGDAVRAELGN